MIIKYLNFEVNKKNFLFFFLPIFFLIIFAIIIKIDIFTTLHLAITLMTTLLIFYLCFSFFNNFDKFTESHAPEVLTTIGIAGCFIGLIFGFFPIAKMSILEKENADLFSKIPSIITSVTLSFISSAVGVIAALVIKFKHKSISEKEKLAENKNNMSVLINEFKNLNENLTQNSNIAIVDELKLLRNEVNLCFSKQNISAEQKMNEVIKNLSNFSDQLVKSSSSTIIEALNKVVKDFNTNITSQFGENFKELNYAVKDLVSWQNQYKDELAIMRISQTQMTEDMQLASKNFSEIATNTKILSNISNEFNTMIENLQQNFHSAMQAHKNLSDAIIPISNIVPEFSKKTNDLISNLDLNMQRIFSTIESHEKTLVLGLQNTHNEMKEILTETVKINQKELSSHVKQITEDMANKVKILDTALETELNKSLETLGRLMASLSEKFVSDYSTINTSITDNFRNILQAIEEIKPENINRVN